MSKGMTQQKDGLEGHDEASFCGADKSLSALTCFQANFYFFLSRLKRLVELAITLHSLLIQDEGWSGAEICTLQVRQVRLIVSMGTIYIQVVRITQCALRWRTGWP